MTMKQFCILLFCSVRLLLKLLTPGGLKAVMAENLMLRQQLIVVNRKRKRAPNLMFLERLSLIFFTGLMKPHRLLKSAIIIKPSTLLKLHKTLIKRKYHALFSNKSKRKPGPAGPSQELINAILDMKKHNPRFGCRRIAMQISNVFNVEIRKDVVWRVLNKHYNNSPKDNSPSWLTFIGHMKDSLWSVDFFRCESISLKSHWVMVIMDQFTRRIIGFAVHKGDLNGVAICVMFNKIKSGEKLPKYLSSDNDPLFRFHRWRANLRIMEVEEIKSVPFSPTSHPFVERLIKSVRSEVLDHSFFWNANDLERKLNHYKEYFNRHRTHMGIDGKTPKQISENIKPDVIDLNNYRWEKHCRGLFHLPIAA